MTQQITYTKAYEQLQSIIREMENSNISIDELDEKVKQASGLLSICRKKLFEVEENVQKVLEEMKEYEEG
ncbi:MAG: exodeoxyribonuclease VII small subunit [Bacteroidales bacterium]